MVAIARESAPADMLIEGATAPFGEGLITDETALATAADAVAAVATPERVEGAGWRRQRPRHAEVPRMHPSTVRARDDGAAPAGGTTP